MIGERTLPQDYAKHALPVLKEPLQGRSRVAREAAARRIIENLNDLKVTI